MFLFAKNLIPPVFAAASFIFLLFSISQNAGYIAIPKPAIDFYVSPSQENSIQEALKLAQPGQTIFLLPGIYYQDIVSVRSGTADAPITILGTKEAVIKGGGNSRMIEIKHNYITLEGFSIDGLHGNPEEKEGYRDMLLYILGAKGLKIIHLNFKNAGGECIRLKYFAQNNEIAYNNIQGCGAYDFKFNDGGKNGEGVYIGTAPEQLSMNPTQDEDNSNNNHIHHNTINTQGNEGVDIKEGSSGNIIEYNTISGQKDTESAGLDSRGDGNIFRYNDVEGSAGAGIRFGGDDGYGKNNSAYGNKLTDNKYGAIKIMVQPQGKICGNELSGNGSGTGNYGKNYNYTAECQGVPAPEPDQTPSEDEQPQPEETNPSCHWVLVCDDNPVPDSGNTATPGLLSPVSASASSYDEREGGQTPENTLDGSIDTRWSADGDGEWILYNLGSVKTISRLQIAFYRGDKRTQDFEIQLSENGKNWETVFSGKSSGKTISFQTFNFEQRQAGDIRIVGYGNNENNWNSLTEVQIIGF